MKQRDPVLTAFGRGIRMRREAKNLTQEALAEKADLDRTYLSDVERGARNPALKIIVRLAHALGVRPAELLEEVTK